MSQNKQVVVVLKDVEPKKHSVRFNSLEAKSPVSSIYINKEALVGLSDAIDKGVKITIEVAD